MPTTFPSLDLCRLTRDASRTLAALTLTLMLTACSETAGKLDLSLTGDKDKAGEDGKPPLSDLDQAGKEYAKNPGDAGNAIAYADKLKQNGRKQEALTVLQQASQANSSDRALTSAYGRLALDIGNISMAKGLLEAADDPSNPDWRVVSARGTVLAKEGKHKESIAYYERARVLSQDQPSVINNLALAYMMSGEPAKAEPLLRQATLADPVNVKVRQNLALVLSLQGKYQEAKQLAARDLSPDAAAANAELLRTIVQAEAKPNSIAKTADWSTRSSDDEAHTPSKSSRPQLRGASVETSSTR